jgi:polysaccharide export outer membrane protein
MFRIAAVFVGVIIALSGCASYPPAPKTVDEQTPVRYQIGPGDTLQISVWNNPEVSTKVEVPPDGYISTPLVQDMLAAGKTSTSLASDIQKALSQYIRNPVVTVIVTKFGGLYSRQIRVIGEAANPQALQYRKGMTLMDVMIAVGGLTEFAAGNRATIIRTVNGERKQYSVRLDDLVRGGDISANVEMLPGDVLIIPESRL